MSDVDCLSVGIAVVDHLCRPIDHLPRAGELVLADRLELATGGCAANVAIDLARLGVRVSLVARVGEDVFGEFLRREMTRQGVETGTLITTPGIETSGTLIVNVRGEDRRFIHCIGANGAMQGSELDPARIAAAKVLYVGGYFAMPGLSPQSVAQWFSTARQAGVTTLLDVVIPGPGSYREALQQILPVTDVFLPNSDEAEIITGETDPWEQARILHGWGARTVVITCGAAGTVVLSEQDRFRSGVFPVEFVDGTGSGDAFDAGFIAGLLRGESLRRCVELGSALGGSCVRQLGATAGVFTSTELTEFLQQQSLKFETL